MLPNAKPGSKFSGQFRFPGPDFLKKHHAASQDSCLILPDPLTPNAFWRRPTELCIVDDVDEKELRGSSSSRSRTCARFSLVTGEVASPDEMSSPPLNEPLPPPPPNITRGPSLVILSVVLHVFSLPIVGTRIWTRAWPRCRLWWDDYTILAAAVCVLPASLSSSHDWVRGCTDAMHVYAGLEKAFDMINWILVLLAVEHGLGRPTIHVPAAAQPSEGRMFLFFAQHASGWAVCFAKLSIALMLFKLRRDDSVLWRTFLLVMMLFPVAMAVTTTATLFSACTPVSAMWDFDIKNFECKSPKKIGEAILATSIITVVTDFVLALLPVTFIVRFKRSVREKVLLAVVMGLGLVASTASLLKIHSVLSKELTGKFFIPLGVSLGWVDIFDVDMLADRRYPRRWGRCYILGNSRDATRVSH